MLGFRQTSVHGFYFGFIRLHLPRRMNLFLFPLRTPRTRKRPPRAPTSPRKSPHGSCSANDNAHRRTQNRPPCPRAPSRAVQNWAPPNTIAEIIARNCSTSPSSKPHKITHLRGRRKQRAAIHTANPPFHTTPPGKFCPAVPAAYFCIVIKTATKYKSKNRRQ